MGNNYLFYAIIVVGVFTAYMAIINIFRRDRMRQRLRAAPTTQYEDDDAAPPVLAAMCRRVLTLFGVDLANQREIVVQLMQAGLNSPHALTYFLFFKRIVQPILFVIGSLVLLKLMIATTPQPFMLKLFEFLVAIILMVAGVLGAKLYVTNNRQRRQHILLRSFPEVLDLLLVCIESGLGLDAALAKVCNEMRATHSVVISEFDRTRIELTVMSDRSQALQNLSERTGIVPFKSLVSALIQTEKFGTSLLDTLRVLSDDIRTTRLMAAEARAARIPVLITIPLILCILPAFIMVILGPPIVRVIEQGGIFGEKHTAK